MIRQILCAGLYTLIAATGATPAGAQKEELGYLPADTYPTEAARARQQGRVVTHLVIGIDGRVKTCTVTVGSGSPALDAGACDIARSKVRYTPAKDANGQPLESVADLPIRFELPSTPPPPGWPDGKTTATPAPAP
jgi:TonB family protein